MMSFSISLFFFFFNDTATTEIYTLSLHDALPIWRIHAVDKCHERGAHRVAFAPRSEEHTSELQLRQYLVCRLLLEKKKKTPCRLAWRRPSRLSPQQAAARGPS